MADFEKAKLELQATHMFLQFEKRRDKREEKYVKRSLCFSYTSLTFALLAFIISTLNFACPRTQSVRIIDKINVNATGNSHQPSSNRNTSLIDTERHLGQTGFDAGNIKTGTINGTGHTNSDHQQTNPANQDSQTSGTSANANK